jgi:hypothetical protein
MHHRNEQDIIEQSCEISEDKIEIHHRAVEESSSREVS